MCPVKNFVNPEIVAAAAAVGINVDPTDPNALAHVKEQFALLNAAAEKLAGGAAEPGAPPSRPPIKKWSVFLDSDPVALNAKTLVHDLLDLLADGLKPFCEVHLQGHFSQNWVIKLKERKVQVQVGRDGQVIWDTQAVLKAISNFPEVFSKSLEREATGYAEELRGARNRVAHQGPITLDDAERWWDTGRRLFKAAGLTSHAAKAAGALAKMRSAGLLEAEPHRTASTKAGARKVPSAAVTAKGSASGGPWSVLADQEIILKAQAEFGSVSLNPFYSNPARTLRPGAIYIVSLNPGGDPASIPSQREDMPLDHKQRAADREDWSKLLDETWGTNYQASVRHLARHALPGGERGLREAFCTNALFMRGNLKSGVDARGLWGACRSWHLDWLKLIRPKAILCLGNGEGVSPYTWFREFLGERAEQDEIQAYGSFALKACIGTLSNQRVTIVGTPHPARWSSSAPRSRAAVEEARRLLAAATA